MVKKGNSPPPPTKKSPDTFGDKKFLQGIKNLTSHLSTYIEQKHYLSAFLVASQMLESYILPKKIETLTKKLKIKHIDCSPDGYNFYLKNLIYLTISHDNDTYLLLEKIRKQRNGLVHELMKSSDAKKAETESKKFLKSGFIEVIDIFQDQDRGKRTVPVFELYSNGWNDCRDLMVQRINSLK